MLEQISATLDKNKVEYQLDNGIFKCKKFDVIPVYRHSDFNVTDILNSRPCKTVFEGELNRDLERLNNYYAAKTRATKKEITIEAKFDEEDVPDFVKVMYLEKDYKSKLKTMDIHFNYQGILVFWVRFLVFSLKEIFLLRPVGHPAYYVPYSTAICLKWIKEHYPHFEKVRTLAVSRLAHYYNIHFKELRAESLKDLALRDPNVDADYKCADRILIYILEYDYNLNLSVRRN